MCLTDKKNTFATTFKKSALHFITLTLYLFSHSAYAVDYQLTGLGVGTAVTAINNNGLIVGTKANSAFIWDITNGLQFIGSLPGGTTYSSAQGLNNVGQVVGVSNTATGNHAFIWEQSTGMTDLGELPGGIDNSTAYDINDTGTVVGTSINAIGHRGFIWTELSGMTDIGDIPGGSNEIYGTSINNMNQVTGHITSGTIINAYIWDPSNGMQSIGDLPTGGEVSYGFAINDNAQVVGRGNTETGDRAFVWTATAGMQSIGTLGFGSYAYAINNAGTIVGHTTVAGAHNAFIWTNNTGMTNLNEIIQSKYPGWTLLEAYDINENGWIIGLATNPNGYQEGFLLQPVSIIPALGDLNGDTIVDIADYVIAELILAEAMTPTLEQRSSLDIAPIVNGIPNPDGVINAADLLLLGKYLLGEITF